MTTPTRVPAFTRRTTAALVATLCAAASALAQTSPTAPAASAAAKEEAIMISRFEVSTTQGKGYVATNSATGFKTNQELIKIPQSVTVVTRDLIDDIGATRTSDVLQFAGASQFYRGESIRLRGARTLNAYMDDAIENVPYSDNVNIDSYEVIRGPAGVLYANAGVAGVVLKSTKKPLSTVQRTLNFSLNDWGQYRGEFDFTGPAGTVGGAKISYRAVGAYQDGDAYFKNVDDRRFAIHPTLQIDLKNTTVRFAFDYADLTNIAGAQNFVLTSGKLYTGAGRDEGYYPKGVMEDHTQIRERVAVLHRFSPNWESKTSISHLKYEREGTNVLPNSLNLQTNVFNLFARRNYQRLENWVLNQDFLGNYKIGVVENQSAAGFTLTDEYVRAAFTNSAAFGVQGFPIANPQMDKVVVPSLESYGPSSVTGSWTNNRRSTYYYQHQATVIPDRLILVGGLSAATLQINDVPVITARNTAGGTRVVNFDETLHRYGVVVNVTKDIAVFGLDSTTFAPQGNSNTRDINGVLLPAQVGKGKEVGVKTALFDGKLSATLSFYNMELTNVAVLQGGISPITGISYFIASGLQKQKGWDATVAYSPIPEWQILVSAYKGTVKDQNGAKLNNTYDSLYSFFTRYDFAPGPLKGFSIGGGASKTGGNYFATAGNITYPVGVTPHPITLESVWNATAFVGYRYDKNWTFRLNVENVLDKEFAMGAQSPLFVDPSPPRTFKLSTSYKF
ncbi:TonB-dependent siderophore receptor [Horticoccus sp. 23ND18S-11]|uniref:TonB-dependent siderophore receptor n=1 Tax=Horticoccus sp. 23ND18S-11 TaxID=3391832 RepID=UPI0039C91EFF